MQNRASNPAQLHAHTGDSDDDDFSELNPEDILEVYDGPEEGEGGEPMEEDDEGENAFDYPDISSIQFRGHNKPIFTLSVHPGSSLVVSGGEDDRGFLWDSKTGEQLQLLDGHTDSVTASGFSHDGNFVATAGMDGKTRVWKAKNESWQEWEFCVELEGPEEVNSIAWHPVGSVLAVGGNDGLVFMFYLPSGRTMHVLSSHSTPITNLRWTGDGKTLISSSEDGTLIIWDPKTGSPVHKLLPSDARFSLPGGITSLTVNPLGTLAIVGGAEGGGLRIVNVGDGTVLNALEGHEEESSVEAIGFASTATGSGGGVGGGELFVSAATDGKVVIWDLSTGRVRSTGTHDDAVTSLDFFNLTFVTGSSDGTCKIWDLRTGTVKGTLTGNKSIVNDVKWTRDGRAVITAGEDGVARVFEISASTF
ncbi:WD40 repeat-like protein [Atractiella rhizophila]|nr:WD40 repeat-like protein [Atractiella rhizophila]